MTPADRLKAALAGLPSQVEAGCRAALAEVAAAASREAQRQLPPGPLAESITATLDPETGVATVAVADPNARLVEYGTTRQPARPFLRPAATAAAQEAAGPLAEALAKSVTTAMDKS